MVIDSYSPANTAGTVGKPKKTSISDSLAGIAADYVEDCDTYEEQAVARMLSSEAMRERAEENEAQEQITYLQTYDAALEETQRNLERAETLAERAASGDYSDEELAAMNEEYQQICAEIDGDSPLVYSVNAVTSVNRSASVGASCTATGLWEQNYQMAVCDNENSKPFVPIYTDPDGNPINSEYDLSKWQDSYINSSSATREERQKYFDWLSAINDLNAKAIAQVDNDYDLDTDAFKFTWSVNNQTYECRVDENGVPAEGISVPLWDDNMVNNNIGPKVYINNLRFKYSDEDIYDKWWGGKYDFEVKVNAHISLQPRTTVNGVEVITSINQLSDGYKEIWLNNGQVSTTLTYRGGGIWEDNFGGSGDKDYYGIGYSNGIFHKLNSEGTRYEPIDLTDASGDMPIGISIRFRVTTPISLNTRSDGYVWNNSAVHKEYDYKLGEYDPANPSVGGIDPDVAIDGAVYKYDVTKQVNGVNGAWTNSAGEVVNLIDEGVHLPYRDSWSLVRPLHHGMTLTISNPGNPQTPPTGNGSSASGSASGNNGRSGKTGNDFPLVIQAGARTKDAIGFTFNYFMKGGDERIKNATSSSGLGINTLSLNTAANARNAAAGLQRAQSEVSSVRSDLAAAERQISSLVDAHSTRTMNAEEAAILSDELNENITHNNAQAMLAQANLPQNILAVIDE